MVRGWSASSLTDGEWHKTDAWCYCTLTLIAYASSLSWVQYLLLSILYFLRHSRHSINFVLHARKPALCTSLCSYFVYCLLSFKKITRGMVLQAAFVSNSVNRCWSLLSNHSIILSFILSSWVTTLSLSRSQRIHSLFQEHCTWGRTLYGHHAHKHPHNHSHLGTSRVAGFPLLACFCEVPVSILEHLKKYLPYLFFVCW